MCFDCGCFGRIKQWLKGEDKHGYEDGGAHEHD